MVSIERLYHFNCPYCGKYWSIGDWTVVKFVFCTHCGKKIKIGDIIELEEPS